MKTMCKINTRVCLGLGGLVQAAEIAWQQVGAQVLLAYVSLGNHAVGDVHVLSQYLANR
jgi:hypothetical protein